jgi:phage tail sheath protein FI
MPEYLSPNVYIEELPGSPPIQGVSTSTAGFIGMAERGPVNWPMLCTSPGDYIYRFGGLLNFDEFVDIGNPPRSHCYLPYAVQGFFTNGGQLCYVMRVLPDTATYAHRFLYNRGNPGDLASVLLRTASQGSGTALLNSPLFLLDGTGVVAGTTLRVGDGSASEFVTVASVTTSYADYFVVDSPLGFSHAVNDPINYFNAAVAGAPYFLAAGANAGDTEIIVLNSDPTFPTTLPKWIQIGSFGAADIAALPASPVITTLSTNVYSVPLQTPLASAHAAGTQISSVTLTATIGDTLKYAASAGDLVVLTKVAPPTAPANETVVARIGSATTQELRTAGQLAQLSIAPAANVDLPANSLIAPTTFGTPGTPLSTTLTADATAGGRVVSLASRTSVNVGTILQFGPAASPEYAIVTAINGTRGFAPDPGSVVLSAPLDGSYATASTVQILPPPTSSASITSTTLSSLVAVGVSVIPLTSVASITAGSVLQIDLGAFLEFATVVAVNVAAKTVQLAQPLSVAHSSGITVTVFESPAMHPVARLFFDAPAGSFTLVASWHDAFSANELISITTPDGEVSYHTILAAPAAPTPALVSVPDLLPLRRTHPMGAPADGREALFTVQALDKGAWGRRLWVAVQDEQPGLVARADIVGVAPPLQLTLATLTGVEPGSYLELFYPNSTAAVDSTPLKVRSINRATATIDLDTALTGPQIAAINAALLTPNNPIAVRSREFRLTVMLYRRPDPAVPSRNQQILQSEVFRFLSMDPRHSHFIETVIGAADGPPALEDGRPKGGSILIRVKDVAAGNSVAQEAPRLGPEPLIDLMPGGLMQPARFQLDQDGDDAITAVDDTMYIGVDDVEPAKRKGIPALRNVPNISIVAIPGQGTADIQSALIAHCENSLYRFAVLDPTAADSSLADIQAQRQAFDTKFAALYYPWLSIPDPMPANLSAIKPFPIPPSGHVVGIYARVDDARGPSKAPANEVVQGITDLTRKLYKGDQDILNPEPCNINVIRDFRPNGRSIRVWGARCITSDTDFMYVPVRRLLMYIEQSIDLGLQWAVFEQNGPQLWSRVTRSIVSFLTDVWRSGALQGSKPEEAFSVQCGLNTMTQQDIDSGRMIALVYVAPVKPAEFVVIRIGLQTGSNGQ